MPPTQGRRPSLHRCLYGREPLLAELLKHLRRNDSLLFHGPAGVGKSAIAFELARRLAGAGTIAVYVSLVTARKALLQELLWQLSGHVETLPEAELYRAGTTVNKLLGEVHKALSSLPSVVAILELENVPEAIRRDLLTLTQRGMTLVVVSRSSSIHRDLDGKLLKVKVQALSEADGRAWIEEALAGRMIEDRDSVVKALLRRSSCHPGAIAEALIQFEGETMVSPATVGRARIQSPTKQRYLYVPVSVICLVSLFCNRYMSRVAHGGGDRVDYVMGALGWVLALTYIMFVFGYLKKPLAATDAAL